MPKSPFLRPGRIVAALVVLAAAAGGGYYWLARPEAAAPGAAAGKGRGPGNRPQPVLVGEVRHTDVRVWVNAIGTAVPLRTVTVRTRVDGELQRLSFREGQTVREGQPLAEIDPRPFQLALAQASGQLQRDSALLQNARLDLERYKALLAQDSIARQQVDTQEALVRQYEGTVAADKSAVDTARLQLGYAFIKSPASGRIGLRQVDAGNQVRASDANGIAVVAQMQPISVVFAVPEIQLPALNKRLKAGKDILVEAWDRDQKSLLARGKLLAADNLVDVATGTIKLKAGFANKDDELFPNQFVNVRLLLTVQKDALTIPTAAIQRGAKGPFVYRVGADNAVSTVPVRPGAIDRDVMAVEAELQDGDRLVVDGGDKLRDGGKVEVVTAAARDAAGRGPGGKGAGRGGEGKAGGDARNAGDAKAGEEKKPAAGAGEAARGEAGPGGPRPAARLAEAAEAPAGPEERRGGRREGSGREAGERRGEWGAREGGGRDGAWRRRADGAPGATGN